MRRRMVAAAVIALGLALAGPAGSQPPTLVPFDLGTLPGGGGSEAYGINDRGQVTGAAEVAPGVWHPFLWENGTMTDLGTLGGTLARQTVINKRGQIAGTSVTTTGETHAFLWTEGTLIDLGTLGGTESVAADINNHGQVVGSSTLPSGDVHAFVFANGVMTDLGTPGGRSEAVDINNRGQIVGSIGFGVTFRAVMWDRDGTRVELGTLPGGGYSRGRAINDRGEIIGDGESANGMPHPFFWRHGVMTDIGTLGGGLSVSWALNDRAQVIGFADNTSGRQQPFLWQDGTITRLPIFGSFGFASDINDRGQIVGTAFDGNHDLGFLWQNGGFRVLRPLPGGYGSAGAAINESRQVVGTSLATDQPPRAVLWRERPH